MWIVAYGNIDTGYSFYGVFEDSEDAIQWAQANLNTAYPWEVCELTGVPDEEE